MNLTTVSHDCPACGDEILVDYADSNKRVTCQHCGVVCTVDHDAELIDGDWKDRTTLHPVEP